MNDIVWKDIKGYEGLYKVNTKGEVFSLISNKILKHQTDRYGYIKIKLYKNKKSILISLHKILAELFIENKENKPQVNHINGVKNDNRIENLEWVTASENIQHAFKNNLMDNVLQASSKTGGINGLVNSKKIKCIKNGIEHYFDSITQASKQIKTDRRNVSACINGRQKTTNGFVCVLLGA